MAQRVKRRHHKDPAALRERSRLAGLASQQPDVLIRRLARMGLTGDQRQLLAEVAAGTDDGAARPDPGPWDADLSAARTAVSGLGMRLAIWQARAEPDARARRCAADAITAIDTALAALHQIRVRTGPRDPPRRRPGRRPRRRPDRRRPGEAVRPPETETAPGRSSPPKAAPASSRRQAPSTGQDRPGRRQAGSGAVSVYCPDHDPILRAGHVRCHTCGRTAYPADAEWVGDRILVAYAPACEHSRPQAWLVDPAATAPIPDWCIALAVTTGSPCRKRPRPGSAFCWQHGPARRRVP